MDNEDFYDDLDEDDGHSFDDYNDDEANVVGIDDKCEEMSMANDPPKNKLVTNLEKLTKSKRLHREECRKIRGKEKRLRRKRKKVN